jgi:hypothetical protein
MKTEQLGDEVDPAAVVAGARGVAELDRWSVQHLVDDALRERLERLPRRFVGVRQPSQGTGDLGAPDLLELLAE